MDDNEVALAMPEPRTLALLEQDGQAARDYARESLSPAGCCLRQLPVAIPDDGDDVLGCDVIQIRARDSEARVPELSLDQVHRHEFSNEIRSVAMAKTVSMYPFFDPGFRSESR